MDLQLFGIDKDSFSIICVLYLLLLLLLYLDLLLTYIAMECVQLQTDLIRSRLLKPPECCTVNLPCNSV